MVFNLFIQLLLDECGDSYAVDGRFCLFVCPVRARAYARSCVRQTEFATVQESAVFSAITRENSALTQTLLMRLQAQSALALALESTRSFHFALRLGLTPSYMAETNHYADQLSLATNKIDKIMICIFYTFCGFRAYIN